MVKYFCMGLVILLAYYSYTVVELLQINKSLVLHHNENCVRIETPLPSEDLIIFGDFIIGATADAIPMYYAHLKAETVRPGFLLSINPKTKAVSQIDTKNLPKGLQINAHGLTLFGTNTLYLLSHSYSKGGELVFVFELFVEDEKVVAVYKDHFSFGENSDGLYNGIAVISEKQFYVTQWVPFADSAKGRDNSFFTTFKRMGVSIYTTSNPVRFCTVKADRTVECVDKTYGYIPNGILYKDGKLFYADSIDRSVSIFEVGKNFDLGLIQKVKISHTLDNLCAVGKNVYVTGISKLVDYLLFGESVKAENGKLHFVPGGFSRVFEEKGTWKAEEVLMQDLISLPSSVAIVDGIVTLTSIIDPALVFCKMPTHN